MPTLAEVKRPKLAADQLPDGVGLHLCGRAQTDGVGLTPRTDRIVQLISR
jgi:hypothetical protein